MKKSFNILLVLIIAFFTLPFGGNTVLADEKAYDNIKDGDYDITAKALNKDTDEKSGAAGFINEEAKLSIQDGEVEFTITIPDNEMAEIKGLQVEDIEPKVKEDDEARYMTYKLDSLESELSAQVQYEVPSLEMNHDVSFKFVLEGLDELPIVDKDSETSEEPADDNSGESDDQSENGSDNDENEGELGDSEENEGSDKNGSNGSENEGRVVTPNETIIENTTQLTMPKDLPEDVKVTITPKEKVENQGNLEIAGDVLEYEFENLGENQGTFELVMGYDQKKYNSDDYDVDIYYYNEEKGKWEAQDGTAKDGQITVDVDHFSTYGVFAEKVESSDEDESDGTENSTDPIVVPENPEEIDYTIMHENGNKKSTADSFFVKPGLLLEKDGKKYVQVTITNGDMVKDLSSEYGDASIVKENDDESIDVQFRVNDGLSDTLLDMRIVVPGMYDSTHEAMFVFTEEEPIEDPKTDPKKEPKENPNEEPKEEELLTPDKAYEIDYVINHEDGSKPSISNDFFEKPAFLLEKDGKKYVQMKIINGDMITELSNKYGDALLVKENDDGSIVVQLRINEDLSDMLLDMHVVVPPGAIPGFPGYDEDHKAIFVFDKDSMKEIDSSKFQLVDSGDGKTLGEDDDDEQPNEDPENLNKVTNTDDTPEKPEFGSNGDNGKGSNTGNGGNTQNPQTGDTSNILLYALLLIGSVIPLGVKLKRRFI